MVAIEYNKVRFEMMSLNNLLWYNNNVNEILINLGRWCNGESTKERKERMRSKGKKGEKAAKK